MTETVLCVENVSRRFGGLQALRSVSFSVPQGQIVGLIGPNGAGKTTLFNVLVGLLRPTSGSIKLFGVEIARLHPHQIVRIGMMKTFQTVALFSEMTVLDNVLTAALYRETLSVARSHAEAALDRVGISSIAQKLTTELTFPERALVELARALTTRAKVLLLDEVMAALTRVDMQEVVRLISSLPKDGITVMVVEHHMHAVMGLSDRILVLDYGQLIADGTPHEVVHNPEVVRAYLGTGYQTAQVGVAADA
jgi:branched-chain amino acid transport system ATP-binding protein